MQIIHEKTLEELVAEEVGDLYVRILKLRTVIEQQKGEIATLKAEIAKLKPEVTK